MLSLVDVTLFPKFQWVDRTASADALQNATDSGAGPDVTFAVRVTAEWLAGADGHVKAPAGAKPEEVGPARRGVDAPAKAAARSRRPRVARIAKVR